MCVCVCLRGVREKRGGGCRERGEWREEHRADTQHKHTSCRDSSAFPLSRYGGMLFMTVSMTERGLRPSDGRRAMVVMISSLAYGLQDGLGVVSGSFT